ncbi:MAG: Ig-like domain-containing protein, partial [Synergistaceae bacterium]|nr:Ig-like domain-containing protein [Synergistaceae bacterium]
YTAPNILVSSIAANPKTLTLYVNDSAIVNALITPSNASNQQVAWSSGSPLVASVAADGTVIALSPGVTTVTVTAQDGSNKTDTCIVTVLSRSVAGITLSPSSMSLTVGQEQNLLPTISPSNATNKNLIWGSSNPLVVTVDENGHITAIASGTATVTVTTEDGGKQASCVITVTAPGAIPVYALQVVPSEWEMYPGDQKLLGVIFFPDSATNKGLAWASSNTAAATVDANGLVTAVATGYAEITATAADNPAKTSTCGIAVLSGINPTNGVSGVDLLAPAMGNLAAGQTRKFLAEINPPNADVQGVTWTSNNPAVATVDSTGLVTIIGPGTVTITVDTNDGHYTDSVTFTVPGGGGGGGTTNVPVVRVDLTQTNASIQEGQTFALFYNLYPSNATNKKIVWTNSSPDILSFAVLSEDVGLGGILVKGIHAGQSRITVTTQDGQKTASCLFTVGPGGNLIPVTSVSVSPTTLALATGESKQLTATVLPADATNKNVIWRSSNPLIAIVSANGTVSGVSGGTVTITAVTEDSARTATSTVVVGGGSGGSSGCNSGFSLLVLAAGLPLVIRKRRN